MHMYMYIRLQRENIIKIDMKIIFIHLYIYILFSHTVEQRGV